jgi:hypothetical protein
LSQRPVPLNWEERGNHCASTHTGWAEKLANPVFRQDRLVQVDAEAGFLRARKYRHPRRHERHRGQSKGGHSPLEIWLTPKFQHLRATEMVTATTVATVATVVT